jgi:hypothetical protein
MPTTPSRTGRGWRRVSTADPDRRGQHQDRPVTSHKGYSVNFPSDYRLYFPLPAASAPSALNIEGTHASAGSV